MSDGSKVTSGASIRGSGPGRARTYDVVLEVKQSEIDVEDRRFQFRVGMSTVEIEDCIRIHGQQVPVTLWSRSPYIIIDGFRRVHALRNIGHQTVKAIVRDDLDEHGAYQLAFIENAKRRSWTSLERALAVRVAVNERKLPLEQVCAELTLSTRQIQRYLQMADFDPQLEQALREGRISMAHAALLHRVASPEDMESYIAEAGQMSMNALKRKLKGRRRGRPRSYYSVVGPGFRISSFTYSPATPASEKQRMLSALERALATVRSTQT